MFFDEPGTEKTWIAVVQDRCFAETCDEDAILSDWYSTQSDFPGSRSDRRPAQTLGGLGEAKHVS